MGFFDYTALAGRAIGTVIGAYFGGPMGASLGGMAGEAEGGKIGQIGKGEQSWTTMLQPGPAQQEQQGPPAQLGPLAAQSLGDTNASLGNLMSNNASDRQNLIQNPDQWSFQMPDGNNGNGGMGNYLMADNRGYSILNQPEQYSDPTSGTPAPATPTTAQPNGWDTFGKAMTGIGRTLSGTAAGLQGDNTYWARTNALLDEAANRSITLDIQEKQQHQQTLEALPKQLDVLDRVRDLNLTPDQLPKVAEMLHSQGITMFGNPQQLQEHITGGSTSLDKIKQNYDVTKDWPDEALKPIVKLVQKGQLEQAGKIISQRALEISGKIAEARKAVPDNYKMLFTGEDQKVYQQRVGNVQLKQIKEAFNSNQLNPKISEADFEAKFPNTDAMDEKAWAQVTAMLPQIKGPGLKQAEQTSAVTLTRQQEMQASAAALQAEKDVAVERRFQQAQAGIESRFQEAQKNRGADLIAAQQEAKQNAPLDTNATRWVNPETLQAAPPDMTPREAKAAGYAVIEAKLGQAIPMAKVALQTFKEYDELSKKLLVDTTGMTPTKAAASIQANRLRLKGLDLAGNPDVNRFNALLSTVTVQVKAFADTGNVTMPERLITAEAMPNFNDSQQSAAAKLHSRELLLKDVIRSGISASARKTKEPVTGASQSEIDAAKKRLGIQ